MASLFDVTNTDLPKTTADLQGILGEVADRVVRLVHMDPAPDLRWRYDQASIEMDDALDREDHKAIGEGVYDLMAISLALALVRTP